MEQIGRRRIIGLGLAAALAAGARIASAEVSTAEGTGAIEGVVRDEAGTPVPGATVTVASFDLPDGEAVLTSDAGGAFRLDAAPPGLYDLFVDLEGFQRAEWRDVRVEAGAAARAEITLLKRPSGY
jgi:hypothetical protein